MTIKPALGPEQWAQVPLGHGLHLGDLNVYVPRDGRSLNVDTPTGYDCGMVVDHERHALAALALHQQSFGFTWDDVDALRQIETELDSWIDGFADDDGDYTTTPEFKRLGVICSLADQIEALLSPRENTGQP